jgi:hypothetical protein
MLASSRVHQADGVRTDFHLIFYQFDSHRVLDRPQAVFCVGVANGRISAIGPVANSWRLLLVEHAGGMCTSEPEVA